MLLRPSLLVRHLLAPLLPGVIFCGDRQRRELALTIDDGPSPGTDGSSHTGSMALLAFPPGLRSGRCPAPVRSGAAHWSCAGSGPAVAGSGPRCSAATGASSHLAHHLR
ncbi:hypothetical protein [Vulcanococcus limneticus]|uniref:hypothetical protein n=1 Tax=Vulcanococcus limneticus TaxID=2170428 RepID=UPI00398BF7F4